jgi:DNA-binding response OmpR family regulator
MPSSILVVEDDRTMGAALCRALTEAGHDAEHAPDLARARDAYAGRHPDLVVLDLGLPDGDGVRWCSEIHRDDALLPIIIVTARTSELDVVVGLDAGAVDYVVKPFRLAELLARVAANLRRQETPPPSPAPQIDVGDLVIDVAGRRTFVGPEEIELRPREFELLVRLARDAGTVVRRENLMTDVWDEHYFGSTKTLDVHIAQLRKKLDPPDGPSRIVTVPRVGYRLDVRP